MDGQAGTIVSTEVVSTLGAAAVAVIALVLGHLAGSIPVSRLVGRMAGVDVLAAGERNPGSANVWKLAGPGWGFLALTGDLAKGILPVAIGIVTVGWWAGWMAGVGALSGACWPLLGRWPGGRGVAVFSGIAIALCPPAGVAALIIVLAVLGTAKLIDRNGRVAAITTGIALYPFLFLPIQDDLRRMPAIGVLYLVAALRFATTARPRPE